MHPYIEIIALELTSKNICPDDLRAFILHFFTFYTLQIFTLIVK